MLLASQMNADFGWMILIGLCAAIPGMIIAGPLWGNFISRYVELHIPDDISEPHLGEGKIRRIGHARHGRERERAADLDVSDLHHAISSSTGQWSLP